MRFSTIAIVASVIAAVSAVEYPFKDNGPCVQKCLDDIGKQVYPDFTSDPNNPHFMESLSFAHEKGTPKYTNYMAKTGMCYSNCPRPELDLYIAQFQPKTDWYLAQKNGGVAPTNTTSGSGPKPTNAAVGVSASGAFVGAAALVGVVAALL
ncbi:hypothetical protein BGZ83_003562 [Gryganskiella cystojenkinii]|nr:hypothetical protein BGZ83_003562 [Gryganskiella cystojenkinii]